ncbi:MAG TPA: nucleotide sugar dehydrogenase [Egibacteraceae bacterium]|jgi:UDP-N-acetyl-D-glucosamine dehydrogenase|nr:nucleotide sugar dehydrogenase [Egibacteraceae bacterium]
MGNRREVRVLVVGQGYVGLPLAMRAVEVGHTVCGYDADPGRVARLVAGESYVEDIGDERLRAAIATGRYSASSDSGCCTGFDVAVVTVPTPLREGLPDLSYIEQAAETIGAHLRPGNTAVLESTTYPGTTEELFGPILERASGLTAGKDFFLGYSPERIDPGNPVWNLVNTPKVVSGIDAASLAAVQAFYDTLVDKTFPVRGCKEAELTKLLENTFRHVNVALVNELAMFASDLGIDVWEAIDAAASKPFGFMSFRPGPGVGGHCLPIDPSYLSWRVKRQLGESFRFVELANDINDHMPAYVVQRVQVALNRFERAVKGSRILLLGLAYKRNTSDDRESPAVVVADRLVGLGAHVRAADPHVLGQHADQRVVRVELNADEVEAADLVVVLTDHDAFDYELVGAARHVLDTRRRLDPAPNVEYL